MATHNVRLTPHTDRTPAVVEVSRELSGAQWCARFPGTNEIGALDVSFRSGVQNFKAAMETAGIGVRVSATYRPVERAYLMHYAVRVANGSIAPDAVPDLAGVNIEWDHGEIGASKQAAQAMANAYNIVFPPAYPTRHSLRLAIDMTLANVRNKTVKDAEGNDVDIGREADLYPVGASYGVLKLVVDRPHWSDNGQ